MDKLSYKKAFWSIILIAIGIMFLAKNFGWISITWNEIWHLWPILFILWGISILPIKDLVKIISSACVIIISTILIVCIKPNHSTSFRENHTNVNVDYDNDNDYDNNDTTTYNSSTAALAPVNGYSSLKYENEQNVELSMETAVGKYLIGPSIDNSILIGVSNKDGKNSYSLTSANGTTNNKKITFSLPDGNYKIDSTVNFNLNLNSQPVWNLDIDCGAANLIIDGKNLKIHKIDIEEGVAKTNLTIGTLNDNVDISCDSGISDIVINIPKDAYCEIETDGALNKKSLSGFTSKNNKYIYNGQINNPSCKIHIDLSIALSKLKINTY